MDEIRCLFRYLRYAVEGASQCYLGVTQDVPLDDKQIVWEQYKQAFDEHILAPILEHLEEKRCGVAELCLAALKLLEVAGVSAEMIELNETRELN